MNINLIASPSMKTLGISYLAAYVCVLHGRRDRILFLTDESPVSLQFMGRFGPKSVPWSSAGSSVGLCHSGRAGRERNSKAGARVSTSGWLEIAGQRHGSGSGCGGSPLPGLSQGCCGRAAPSLGSGVCSRKGPQRGHRARGGRDTSHSFPCKSRRACGSKWWSLQDRN